MFVVRSSSHMDTSLVYTGIISSLKLGGLMHCWSMRGLNPLLIMRQHFPVEGEKGTLLVYVYITAVRPMFEKEFQMSAVSKMKFVSQKPTINNSFETKNNK
mmetsp:Transcript_30569/g.91365  ORF Transcript_30569/g.91365 Transcript_30569/m.91365 type:complete len:101 (+) Transcript_30569:255-557(+)